MDRRSDIRSCPECSHGSVEVAGIHHGNHCSSCGKLIEVDFAWNAGIPVLLGLCAGLCFNNSLGPIGLVLTGALIVYCAGYNSLVAKYIPLKHYQDHSN